MATTGQRPNVVLPKYLTIEGLHLAFSDVPITAASTEDLNMLPSFRPRSPFRIDGSRLMGGTPEAMCYLAALMRWLRHQVPDYVVVDSPSHSLATECGLDERLSARPFETDAELRPSESFLLPVHELAIPEYSNVATDASKNDRTDIRSIAGRVAECAALAFEPNDASEIVRKAVAECVWESLLNVYEHAYERMPSAFRPAWVAASVVSRAGIERDLQTPGSEPRTQRRTPAELEWLAEQAASRSKFVLEIGIADAGIGVPASLGNRFLELHPGYRRGLAQKGRSHWSPIHDDVLRWALSPYGSRKQRSDYRTAALAEAWRGLYRVLYRARRCNGFVVLRSGLGAIGHAFGPQRTRELGHNDLGLERAKTSWPGTAVRLLIALPFLDDIPELHREWAAAPAHISSYVLVDAKARESLRANQPDFERYRTAVDAALSEAFRASDRIAEGDLSTANQLVGIVHPAVSLIGGDAATVRAADDVTVVSSEDDQAAELLHILGRRGCPGLIPVHLFLNVTEGAVELAAAMFSRPPAPMEMDRRLEDDTIPSVVGFARPRTGEISWFIHVTGAPEEMQLAASGEMHVSNSDHAPASISELQATYPGICNSDETGTIRLVLPRTVSVPSTAQAMTRLLPALASLSESETRSWYWQSRNPKKEILRTAKGRYVGQYASVYRLCATFSVVDDVLTGVIERLVLPQLQSAQRAVLFPASRTTAYLLARRIAHRIGRPIKLAVVHPDDIHRIRDGDSVFAFTDLVYAGDHLRQCLETVASTRNFAGVISCVDARPRDPDGPLTPALDQLGSRAFSLCRWPFDPPFTASDVKDSETFIVDPLTNEILDRNAEQEAAAYASLLWRSPESGQGDPEWAGLLDGSMFRYGFQKVGGRVQVVRCPIVGILDNPKVLDFLVARMAGDADLPAKTSRDIVLFARDESDLWNRIQGVAAGFLSWLRRDTQWVGRLFIAPVLTTRFGERQLIRHQVGTSLLEARTANADQTGAVHVSLFTGGTGDLPHEGFHAIFIDNAAVTGRAIRDFAVALANLEGPTTAASLQLLPLVDRLSPSEERLLRKVTGVSRRQASDVPIRLTFSSVVQLRVRSYVDFRQTAFYRRMDEVFRRADEVADRALTIWLARFRRSLERLAERETDPREGAPFGSEPDNVLVTVDAVYLRHLLAIAQQGIPVVENIISVVRRIVSARDVTALTVFALEPDLLSDEVVAHSFGSDIAELAWDAIQTDHSLAIRTNALLVLGLQPGSFGARAGEVARVAAADAELRPLWLTLCVAALDGVERHRLISATLDSLASFEGVGDQRPAVGDVVRMLRVERFVEGMLIPRNEAEAKTAVWHLLRHTRARHGDDGFGSWWRIRSVALAMEGNPSYKPTAAEFSEITWHNAERLLREVIYPGAAGLAILAHAHSRVDRRTILRELKELIAAFGRAKDIADRLGLGEAVQNAFVAAWRDVRRWSFDASVDVLLTRQGESLLANRRRSRIPLLDFLLPEVVVEPIALLAHALADEVSSNQPLSLQITTRSGVVLENTASLTEQFVWLNRRWETGPAIPTLWHGSHSLRQAYKILAENVRRHADRSRPLTIEVHENEKALSIALITERANPPRPGDLRGTGQVRQLFEAIGGTFAPSNTAPPSPYRTVQIVPVEWLYLPSLED
jgi:hypothetical protein